jgi:hypothetical protein
LTLFRCSISRPSSGRVINRGSLAGVGVPSSASVGSGFPGSVTSSFDLRMSAGAITAVCSKASAVGGTSASCLVLSLASGVTVLP